MGDMLEEIVKKLKDASDAYYNATGGALMGDDEYDALKDRLEELAPNHPFLKIVGAPVKDGCVTLPVPLPSLNKIKPGLGTVENFRRTSSVSRWVLSDKLDGISAVWVPKKTAMYLRGDGAVGQDVSQIARMGIQGIPIRLDAGFMVRGELVLPKALTPANTIGRSWVNGIFHQKTPAREEVAKIRFVAYEIVSDTTHTRSQQLEILKKKGYEIPWVSVVGELSEETLTRNLTARRQESKYDIDGIVVGVDTVPQWHSGDKSVANPKDCVAFKMVMADQCAETVVKKVHWNLSHQGYFTPRLEIEPVRVGGAVISFLTGHNAQLIVEKGIGAGARIRIRRSGDVIPTIDAVLQPAKSTELPPEGTWVWNGPYIVSKSGTEEAIVESRLKHFATSLGIDGLGPGLVKKIVASGIKTPRALCGATVDALGEIVGKKIGANLASEIQKRLTVSNEMTFMIASATMPRGVGETKLKSLFALESNPRKWRGTIQSAEGWSDDALTTFLGGLDSYFKWREEQFPSVAQTPVAPAPVAANQKGAICFTGFRSADLEAAAIRKGFSVSATVSKKVIALLVPDAGEETGTKIEKARELGIRIVRKSEFMRENNIVL